LIIAGQPKDIVMDTLRRHPILMHLLSALGDIAHLSPKGPLSAVTNADPAMARCAAIDAAIARDTGMPAEDATGIKTYQPDLPFFMQSGFGSR
jgi:hypothetical protein